MPAPTCCAFWIASAPSASFMPTGQPKGFSAAFIARPHQAMAHLGSVWVISVNAAWADFQANE